MILPPKLRRSAPRLLVAPAPRAPRIAALVGPAPIPASASRARVGPKADVWLRVDEAAARLGRTPPNADQRRAIRAALEGQHSLVVLPDDEQSLGCYQTAALLLDRPTVVVSPVACELQRQHEMLLQRRVAALWLRPDWTGKERSQALARIAKGGALLVLCNPEALREVDVLRALGKPGVGLFVIEEAHCAADSAHELRPSYTELRATLRSLGAPPVMALSRVASRSVRGEIGERLGLNSPVIVQSAAVRGNLSILSKLARGEARQASIVRMVSRLELPGLIFCATPHDADGVYAALRAAGVASHRFHASMTAEDRALEQAGFDDPSARSVMVAVSAFAPSSGLPGLGEPANGVLGFGRGALRADLRFVVHYQSPAFIEQYLREIQCVGRDGLPATCVLLHESSHRSLHEVMLAQQRFRATHLADLGRALEASALAGAAISIGSLALSTGQSRRTTDRLTSLLADVGAVSREGGSVRVLCSASELFETCRKLGLQLYALREQDGRRLAAVTAFAETNGCKLAFLQHYLGEPAGVSCGRCDACSGELLSSQESIPPQASARRASAEEFSVRPLTNPPTSGVRSEIAAGPGAKLASFGRPNPRGGR